MLPTPKLEESPAPQPNSRPPSAIFFIVAALLVGGIGIFVVNRMRTANAPPKRVPVVNVPEIKTVTALGRLEPQGEVIKLSAPTSNQGSRVEQLLVKEGDRVTKGQIIAIMENRDRLQASLKEAERKVAVAKAQREQVKAGAKKGELAARSADINRLQTELTGDVNTQQATIARLTAELQGQKQSLQATVARIAAERRNAQIEVQRYENLYREGVISSQEVDRRRLSAETSTQQLLESQATQNRTIATLEQQIREAKANLNKTVGSMQQQIKQAQGTLAQTAEVRPTDIAAAEAEINSAQATVERIRAELALAYIRAPKTGRVLKINTRAGETVGNEGIIDFGETNQMYAVAEVYQSDVSKVKQGQKVRITSDSLPQELQGTVDWIGYQVQRQNIINSDPSSNIDSRIVEVHVRLDNDSSEQAGKFTNLQIQAVIDI
ncbi:ABC exporter membrane fusion protein [Calothrix sp. UHCC 0171]|uniref:ABC exporter membrane fusion protein n=1 Tax=Calothrix sp. UHCC 0171 TaxID=3110245 RepID=UPI002B1EE44E|nr:ABC exporter membrane fusion protein [Calothrix sp. UHCC 0171]MEA5573352.1 ABC exporter membrane fusion protein [Calothrix sp. UHCC 0171]